MYTDYYYYDSNMENFPEDENMTEEEYYEDYDYDYDNIEVGFNPYSGSYDFDC